MAMLRLTEAYIKHQATDKYKGASWFDVSLNLLC